MLQMDLITADRSKLSELADSLGANAPAYFAFRAHFGPQIGSAIQAAIGEVLAGSSVCADGLVTLDLSARREPLDKLASFGARLDWLTHEIASLQESYGQLYEAEWLELQPVLDEVDVLDLLDPDDYLRAQQVWPHLEMMYRYAHKGARIYRGDEVAIAGAREFIEDMGRRIDEAEADRKRVIDLAAGTIGPESTQDTLDAIREVQIQRREAESARDRFKERAGVADAEVLEHAQRLTDLVMSLPDDVEPPDEE